MRPITPVLTSELQRHLDIGESKDVARSPAYFVPEYPVLMKVMAKLSFLNQDYLLFFRGQLRDYPTKSGASSFYPSIYRGESLSKNELNLRISILRNAEEQLKKLFANSKMDGLREINRRQEVRWSILQHYNVCQTPLLDFTHTLCVLRVHLHNQIMMQKMDMFMCLVYHTFPIGFQLIQSIISSMFVS